MTFLAGSIEAHLGGRLDQSAFVAFDRRMHTSAATMEAGEKRMRGSAERISAATAAMGRAAKVAAVGGIGAVGYALVKSAQQAADFETGMRNVNSIAGLSERQLKSLSARVLDLSIKSGKAPKDLAAGLYDIVSTGFKADDAVKILAVSTKAAAAGLTDTATATDVMTSALSAYGLGAGNARHVSDILFQAVNVGKLSFAELAGSIGTVLPSAAALGIPLKDVAAAMAAITLNGTSADEAATQLSGVMTQLTKPSEALKAQFKSMGYESGQAAIEALGFKGVLDKLGQAAGGNQQTLQEWFSDIRAVRGVQGLEGTAHAASVFTASTKAMDQAIKGAGQTQKAYKEQQKGFNAQLDHAKAAMNVLAITAGTQLLPVLTDLAKEFTAWVDGLDPADIERFGQGAADALREVVDIVGEVIDVGGDMVGVLTSVGNALGLSDVETFAAIGAAILAWKAARTVGGGVLFLVSAVQRLAGASRALAAGQGASAVLSALTGVGGAAGAGIGTGALAGTVGRLAVGLARVAGPLAATIASAKVANDAILNLIGASGSTGEEDFDRLGDPLASTKLSLEDLKDAGVGVVNALDFVKDGFSDAGDKARNYREWVEKATSASEGAHVGFLRVRAGAEQAGRAYAQSRLTLEQARKALAATTKGTDEHSQALLDYRAALAENIQREREWAETKRLARGLAASQVQATQLQIDKLEALRDAEGLNASQEAQLSSLYKQREARLNTQAALTANLARSYRGMVKATGDAEQSLGRLARAGGRELSTKIALKYEAPKDAGAVAASAARALQAGVPARLVTKIVAETDDARTAVVSFRAVLRGVPPEVVTKVLAKAGDAKTQLAAVKALAAGVPPQRVLKILQDGGPNVIAILRRLTATALPAKTQTVVGNAAPVFSLFAQLAGMVLSPIIQPIIGMFKGTTGRPRAAGKPAGSGEDAIVGEGSRWQGAREAVVNRSTGASYIVDRPTLVRLSDDDYVIPLDEHQGRALGLVRMLARDMGVDGYAKGRTPPHKVSKANRKAQKKALNHHVPERIKLGGVPVADVEQRYDTAKDRYEDARDAVRATTGDWRQAKKDYDDAVRTKADKSTRESAKKRLDEAARKLERQRDSVDRLKAPVTASKKERASARKLDTAVKNLETNLDRDRMDDANRSGDEAAFSKAAKDRQGHLKKLIGKLQAALGTATDGTDYWRDLREKLSQLGGDAAVQGKSDGFGGEFAATGAEEFAADDTGETEADRIADTGMTDAERKRLDDLEAGVSLAGLTATLDDDKAAAQSKRDFLEGILSAVQSDPARGGSPSIRAIADLVKTARDNVESLTTGNGKNDNADLQAQLDQERTARRISDENARIANQAVAVFGSSGDIGSGGVNARGAAAGAPQMVQNNYMLHPSDPSVLSAIGSAATAGISLQGLRRSPREKVGV